MSGRSGKDSEKSRSLEVSHAGNTTSVQGRSGANLLEAASNVLAGGSDAGSDEPWAPEQFRVTRSRHVTLLEAWADREELLIEPQQLGRMEIGGKEHDLFPDIEVGHRIFKVTKGAGFGWYPICERLVGTPSDEFQFRLGTPLQYFRRLHLVNELFPGLNRLDGFVHLNGQFQIVTSQPFVQKARNASLAEIARYLEGRGFVHVCNTTWFRGEDNLAIFDAGEPNILVSERGMVPIDIIPVFVSGYFLQRMITATSK